MKNLKTLFFALTVVLLFFGSGTMWGQTYTFTSKAWADETKSWTSGKDGNAITSGQGVQITTGVSGANATTNNSISGITQIEVKYCTNASAGVGTIKVQVGSNTEKSFSVTKPAKGTGTTLKTATFTYSTAESGKVKVTGECTTNSVYIYSVTIIASTKTAVTLEKGEHGAANGSVTYTVGNTTYDATPTPSWVSASGSYNLTGYFDNNNVKVIDANNALVSGTDYVGSDGKWKYSSTELTLTAKWESAGPSCTTSPSVSAGSISDATASSLTFNCSGGITSLGSDGCSITEYGYVYGTSTNPTTSDTKQQIGTTYTTTSTAFASHTASNLNCGTTYYMRPYAINGNGTAYGTQASLSTSACPTDHFIDDVQGTTGYTGEGKAVSATFTKASVTLADKEPATTGSCEQVHYHFVGWVTADDKASGNVDDGHIVNFQAEGNVPTNTTYHAVWAKEKAE